MVSDASTAMSSHSQGNKIKLIAGYNSRPLLASVHQVITIKDEMFHIILWAGKKEKEQKKRKQQFVDIT